MNNNILFYSFRYALGRKTYAVQDVAEEIIKNKDNLDEKTKAVMISEIEAAKKKDALGMEMDKAVWLKVIKELKMTQSD